jgi:hypothetical protein
VLQAIRNWEEEERRKQEEEKPVPGGLAEPQGPAFPLARPDWFAALLAYPRSFVEDFFVLISGPKRFVAERSAAGT